MEWQRCWGNRQHCCDALKYTRKEACSSGGLASSQTLAPLCPYDFCLFTRYDLHSKEQLMFLEHLQLGSHTASTSHT